MGGPGCRPQRLPGWRSRARQRSTVSSNAVDASCGCAAQVGWTPTWAIRSKASRLLSPYAFLATEVGSWLLLWICELCRGDNLSRGIFCRRSHFVAGGIFGDRNLLWGSVSVAYYDRRRWSALARSMTASLLATGCARGAPSDVHMITIAILVANFNLQGSRIWAARRRRRSRKRA